MDDELFANTEMTLDEVLRAQAAAVDFRRSRQNLEAESFLAGEKSTLDQWRLRRLEAVRDRLLSDMGRALHMVMAIQHPGSVTTFEGFEAEILTNPWNLDHLSSWALYFAARKISNTMQSRHCVAPTSESHLSGALIGGLSESCDTWSEVVATALARMGQTLALHRVDLSILGGEQVTGGDFAIILDFEDPSKLSQRRIVPLIFQAKRYTRPQADISQYHAARGYQRDLLSRNECESAYIFYENDSKKALSQPLPPLAKSVAAVGEALKTNVLEFSVDLPTYLLAALYDESIDCADSPEDALRMIYSKADPGQLTSLAIISGKPENGTLYDLTLQYLAPVILGESEDPQMITITD